MFQGLKRGIVHFSTTNDFGDAVKGPINIYVNRILSFLDHPPTPALVNKGNKKI